VTKVLYVEDNDDNVFMLKMRLELLGDFEVLTAEDGEQGYTIALGPRNARGSTAGKPYEGSRAIRKRATSQSSRPPRMRLPRARKGARGGVQRVRHQTDRI
jgi:CheY-like chemotaxis protein